MLLTMNENTNEHPQVKNNKLNSYIQFVIPVFFTLIFFKQYGNEEGTLIKTFCAMGYIAIGVFMTFFFIFKLKRTSISFLFIMILFLLAFIVSLFSENYRVEDNILVFTYFGIALIPLFVKLNYALFKLLNYALIVFFIVAMVNNVNANEMFSVSRNFISVLLLIALGYHIISCYQNNKTPSLLLFILSLFVAIWATGRAGIFVFSLLLGFYPFVVKLKVGYKILILSFVLSLIAFSFTNYSDYFFEYGLGRFKEMGLESERNSINKDYFEITFNSVQNLLFGSPLRKINVIAQLDNNPHNSFIRLHVYYGLLGFIVVIFFIFYTMKIFLLHKDSLYFVLFLALLLRAFMDSVAFHGPLDTLIFYLIFYSLHNLKIRIR